MLHFNESLEEFLDLVIYSQTKGKLASNNCQIC